MSGHGTRGGAGRGGVGRCAVRAELRRCGAADHTLRASKASRDMSKSSEGRRAGRAESGRAGPGRAALRQHALSYGRGWSRLVAARRDRRDLGEDLKRPIGRGYRPGRYAGRYAVFLLLP